MRNLLKECFLILFSFTFISCEQIMDNYWENKERETTPHPTWEHGLGLIQEAKVES